MRQQQQQQQQRRTAALIVAATGIVGLAFAPVTREFAAAWWLLGLSGLVGAFVLARRQPGRRPSRLWSSAAAFLVAVAAGVALTGIVAPTSASALPPAAHTVEDARLSGVVAAAAGLEEITGDAAGVLVATARAEEYVPRSALEVDWAAAQAFRFESATIVSVPLLGTDVPEMTKIAFTTSAGRTTVTEMVAGMVSSASVHFAQWQDGSLVQNVELHKGERTAAASTIGTRGLDWNRLNTCLNSIGISWAVIAVLGVACGAACATAVLCAPCLAAAAGFTAGTIAKCVSVAWA